MPAPPDDPRGTTARMSDVPDPLRPDDPTTRAGSSAASIPVASAADDSDTAVPGYEVRDEIARGGMGVVLAAYHIALAREVAIKTLRPDRPADARTVGRFVTESHVTAKLQHPGVPPVFEVGQLADGRPYLVMKLVRGRTLEALLKDRPPGGADLPRFLDIFERICQAVGYAHSQGVIHRDLKPSNVMVGEFGEVQVMDWGIAKSGVRGQETEDRVQETGDRRQETGDRR